MALYELVFVMLTIDVQKRAAQSQGAKASAMVTGNGEVPCDGADRCVRPSRTHLGLAETSEGPW